MPPSSLSENPKRLPFCFARLPNLAISSGLFALFMFGYGNPKPAI